MPVSTHGTAVVRSLIHSERMPAITTGLTRRRGVG